ncbi:hypothetical protein [Deinococcus hopiensis]|uniref:hypothetical protein n=1 Tax=Deinococcus hopiensis TaxID=309885 RepID=UPI001FE8D5FC|nr:hypothetical protein [Deinococcus hopiensis]
MKHPWADAGYTGKLAGEQGTFLGWTLESLVRPAKHLGTERRTSTTCGGARGIRGADVVLKRRWVVERTSAWPWKSRRMAGDDEALPETAENPVYEVRIRLMVRRSAKGPP